MITIEVYYENGNIEKEINIFLENDPYFLFKIIQKARKKKIKGVKKIKLMLEIIYYVGDDIEIKDICIYSLSFKNEEFKVLNYNQIISLTLYLDKVNSISFLKKLKLIGYQIDSCLEQNLINYFEKSY